MAKTVNLLDCTLRDGGYIIDWEFGHSVITSTYKRLDAAGVDYIEIGFLDDRREVDFNRTIQPDTKCFDQLFEGIEKKHAIPLVMIDYGTCDIDNISPSEESFIDGIRVIFKKDKINNALPFCQKIKEKGYKLFIQAISITSYSDMEMLTYVKRINEIKPYAFSIVDTYGLLDSRKLTNYFNLIDNNLEPEILIGYHAHNNYQLAFSNSIKFLALEAKRDLIVDATVYGMGKSAGNCAIELISTHLNKRYEKDYDINQFMEILDTDLMSIYQQHYWGYRYDYYISAMQKCHPDYVKSLMNKKMLSVSDVNEILSQIPQEKKLLFDKEYIEKLYFAFQSKQIDDSRYIGLMKEELSNRNVLLIGPGKSLISSKGDIDRFIDGNNPLLIAVNVETNIFDCQYVFISNAKRYGKFCDERKGKSKIILTSNIRAYDIEPDYKINYKSLVENVDDDNALLLCLSFLILCGVKEVSLAGFDGFKSDEQDYYDSHLNFGGNSKYLRNSNAVLRDKLARIGARIKISFITKSLYQ